MKKNIWEEEIMMDMGTGFIFETMVRESFSEELIFRQNERSKQTWMLPEERAFLEAGRKSIKALRQENAVHVSGTEGSHVAQARSKRLGYRRSQGLLPRKVTEAGNIQTEW